MNQSHIDITFDFTHYEGGQVYDLRIPTKLSVKELLLDTVKALKLLAPLKDAKCVLKVKSKGILIADDDVLSDFPITDGDILTVL